MIRERLSLDGPWGFQFDPDGSSASSPTTSWRPVVVPAPWQAQFAELRDRAGTAWYRRTFETPPGWAGSAVILHLGAVDYHAQVWLNGTLLGNHEGGYLPFEFDVGMQLRAGASNELLIRVTDPTADPQRYPDFPFDEIPHGKQSWYGPLSGIWQSVWLERRSAFHVQAVRLIPDLHHERVQAHLTFCAPASRQCQLLAKVLDPAGTPVASSEIVLEAGASAVDLGIPVANPLAWSPDKPHLYSLQVHLLQGQELLDTITELFGFRTIEVLHGRLLLNGQPIYLRGALDQDYYPDTICTPPSEAFLEDQMRKAKALGLNCLRCHIKIADPSYYALADRLGMLVWAELPSWRLFSEQVAQRALATLRGMVERDGNHPSIIIWTIVNEGWGLDLVNDAAHRAWLRQAYQWLKELDPTRLVVDNSPCWPNFHLQTDVEDYHHYKAIPDHRREWDGFVNEFATRPAWTFSPNGDAVRTGHEPLLVSEFGNWGLPDVDLLCDAERGEPCWFESGEDWDQGVVYPHGVRRRFHTWHLDRVFGTWRAFVEATQWQQYAALKYEIETIRRQLEIAGYVITEFTDVHWECNGLLDMRRNPKIFHSELAAINASTVVIPTWERMAYWSGEPVRVGIVVAHGVSTAIENAEVGWHSSSGTAAGRMAVPNLYPGEAQTVGVTAFPAPEVVDPGPLRLNVELIANGRRLASNRLDLVIYPRRRNPVDPASALWVQDPGLAERLAILGYKVVSNLEAARAVVASRLDEVLLAYVRRGGHVLLLADGPDAIGPYLSGIGLAAREGSPWNGDWVSTFAWLRRAGPFARFPGGPLLDFSFERVIPNYVLTGFGPWDFESYVHAGLFVGWIHRPVALLAEKRYGKGRLVLTTFRLPADALGPDPVATTLLDALIELTVRQS